MCGDVAFGGKTGGQDDFFDRIVGNPQQQLLQADIAGADAVERAEPPHQDKIKTAKTAAAFKRGLIGGRFNNTKQARVAFRVEAGLADHVFGKSVATLAVANPRDGVLQRAGQLIGAITIMLQQVERHSLR